MKKKGQLVCRGDICSVSLDLFEYCGLNHLTERQKKELWMQVTEIDLLEDSGAIIEFTGEIKTEEIGEHEYTYLADASAKIEVYTKDKTDLKRRLWANIFRYLDINPFEQTQ